MGLERERERERRGEGEKERKREQERQRKKGERERERQRDSEREREGQGEREKEREKERERERWREHGEFRPPKNLSKRCAGLGPLWRRRQDFSEGIQGPGSGAFSGGVANLLHCVPTRLALGCTATDTITADTSTTTTTTRADRVLFRRMRNAGGQDSVKV